MTVLKSGEVVNRAEPAGTPDAAALEKIGRYTRRAFLPGELYVFPVALCDNEVDRDGERFSAEALRKLAGLFPGKTGVFDHDPSAEKQTARIYECRVETDETRRTSCGEPYERLVAQAYLPRTESNRDFITELESGIKKEVSVSCAVRSVTCSICGADLRNGSCEHRRGETYGGKPCCAVLDDPADAYEWSFVAVPAQREAGVLKSWSASGARDAVKALRGGESAALTRAEKDALLGELERLEKEAQSGREYREELRREFLRCGSLAVPDLPAESLRRAADALPVHDLKAWSAALRAQAEKQAPLTPQLAARGRTEKTDGIEPFRI